MSQFEDPEFLKHFMESKTEFDWPEAGGKYRMDESGSHKIVKPAKAIEHKGKKPQTTGG